MRVGGGNEVKRRLQVQLILRRKPGFWQCEGLNASGAPVNAADLSGPRHRLARVILVSANAAVGDPQSKGSVGILGIAVSRKTCPRDFAGIRQQNAFELVLVALAVILAFLSGEMLNGACRVLEKALEGGRHE